MSLYKTLDRLYREIVLRTSLTRDELKGLGGTEGWGRPGRLGKNTRIAAIMSPDELDIMKIAAIGYASLIEAPDQLRVYGMETRENVEDSGKALIAVAKVCPGQSSLRLKHDGTVHLNDLVEVWGSTPTGDNLLRNPIGLDLYPNHSIEDVWEELGPLKGYHKAHWIYLEAQPIVRISKEEMKQMQEAAEIMLQ